jgi:hypothetical protein|tara:strand:- start:992 stop:1174 length:183 start_codon:yes stop_codon:yes gene_type:complete
LASFLGKKKIGGGPQDLKNNGGGPQDWPQPLEKRRHISENMPLDRGTPAIGQSRAVFTTK